MPSENSRAAAGGTVPKLVVRGLRKHFPVGGTLLDRVMGTQPRVKAVDGIDFEVMPGEVFGLLGESGSGKTTVGRLVLGLVGASEGKVLHDEAPITTRLPRRERAKLQIIFQDPLASLNPAMNVYESIEHALLIHTNLGQADRRARVYAIMEKVGLVPPEALATTYPGDLSGGQRQRAVIARAMVLTPDFVVADEPVSMLDMSIRAKVLRLLLDLKNEMGLTYLFITHDLATAKFMCDRVGILYLGQLVEVGPAAEVFGNPLHPYTKALIRAIPIPDPRQAGNKDLPVGEIPDAVRPPAGCRFHPRCPEAGPDCGWEPRDLKDLIDRHLLELAEAEGGAGIERFSLRMREEKGALVLPNRPSVIRFLERLSELAPPLAQAVTERTVAEKEIEVKFRAAVEIGDEVVGDRRVRCLKARSGQATRGPIALL